MNIVFTPQGLGRCLYTEAIDLSRIGKLSVERAISVEFDNKLGAWRAKDRNGFALFTAPTRQECLDWEQQYLETQEDQKHGGSKGIGEPYTGTPVSVGVRQP